MPTATAEDATGGDDSGGSAAAVAADEMDEQRYTCTDEGEGSHPGDAGAAAGAEAPPPPSASENKDKQLSTSKGGTEAMIQAFLHSRTVAAREEWEAAHPQRKRNDGAMAMTMSAASRAGENGVLPLGPPIPPRKPPPPTGTKVYYAVRVGYAAGAPLVSDDEDADDADGDGGSPPSKKRKCADDAPSDSPIHGITSHSAPVVQIRSAIFLYFEDARRFIKGIDCCARHKAEYAAFDSLEGAEKYLNEREGTKAAGVAKKAEVRMARKAELRLARNRAALVEAAAAGNAQKKAQANSQANVQANPQANVQAHALMAQGPFGGAPYMMPYAPVGLVGGFMQYMGGRGTEVAAAGNSTTLTTMKGKPYVAPIEAMQSSSENKDDGETKGDVAPDQCKPTKVELQRMRREKNRKNKWDNMYHRLVEYKEKHGSIDIPEIADDEKNDPEKKALEALRRWCNSQTKQQQRRSLGYSDADSFSDERMEKLKEVGLVVPTYETMYERLAAHKAETDTLEVAGDDDAELFAWAKEQKKFLSQHFTGKDVALSEERIQNLISLGYQQKRTLLYSKPTRSVTDEGSAEAQWNSMLDAAVRYKEKHGSYSFPSTTSSMPKEERAVKYWVAMQRREYKKLRQEKESSMTARRLQRLSDIGLDMNPKPEKIPWEEKIQALREFAAEHGHCRPPHTHPVLGQFTRNMRQHYRKKQEGKYSSLTDERINDLLAVGFVFRAGKTPNATKAVKSWEERFEQLLEYKEEHGHVIVPQKSGPLGGWVKEQRDGLKRMKAGQKTSMTAEKALRLTEIGFCFDASNYRGGSHHGHDSRREASDGAHH